jgi:predicted methyltransferase
MIGRMYCSGLASLCLALVPAPAGAAERGDAAAAAIEAAIASTDRPAADRDEDGRRRPAELLAFLGVEPGMRVLDVFAAGGYYTELLARVVGVKGQVIAYNNPPYADFFSERIEVRYAGDRLSNVRQLTAPIDALGLATRSLDAALFVMSYHDLYWRPEDGSWPATDPAVLLAALRSALRPGAVVVVQDHVAAAGLDPLESVSKLHRIDPAIVRRDFAAAGFEFEAESGMLAHPADDHSLQVFDPGIRGRTDQFVFRFRNPLE